MAISPDCQKYDANSDSFQVPNLAKAEPTKKLTTSMLAEKIRLFAFWGWKPGFNRTFEVIRFVQNRVVCHQNTMDRCVQHEDERRKVNDGYAVRALRYRDRMAAAWPRLPDDFVMDNGSLLIIKLPVERI